MRSFYLAIGIILALNAEAAFSGNMKSSPELFKSRMSRWVEVIGRESLSHSYNMPIQGRYAYDWEKILSVLNFARSQKDIQLHPKLHHMLKQPVLSKDFTANQQFEWIEKLLDNRRSFFGRSDTQLFLTRESFILGAFKRIEISLEAYDKELIPTVKWMYLWDAAVEGKRLHALLKMTEVSPWDFVLDEAKKNFAQNSLAVKSVLLEESSRFKISTWISDARAVSLLKKDTEQNSIAWFLFVREGIESLIVLFCIVGGVGLLKRKWVFAGAVTAFFTSFLLFFMLRLSVALNPNAEWIRYFVLTNVLLSVSLLLFATNFHFHRVYWSSWISKLRVKDFTKSALFMAGFFAIFREGVELSLAMSLLSLEGGGEGIRNAFLMALPLWAFIAFCLFVAEKKLPLRAILVGTGALMILVTVVFAGFSTRLLQSFDWINTTPFITTSDYPLWLENVFAYNGTLESTVSMLATALLLIVPAWTQAIQVFRSLQVKFVKNLLRIFSKSTS